MRYPSTEGTILSSEVTRHRGSKGGTSYGVQVSYKYKVNDVQYTGNNYRYVKFSTSDSAWAYDIVNRLARGTTTPVFYDPVNPGNAVLSTGIEGGDLFMLMFLMPFNMLTVVFLAAPLSALRRKLFKPAAGGVKLISEPRKIRARLYVVPPVAILLFTTGGFAFVGMFIVGILSQGSHPELRTMLIMLVMIIGAAIAVSARYWMRVHSGKYDLVIDELGSTLELPLTYGRDTRIRVPFSSVENVFVETVQKPMANGRRNSTSYAPTLTLRDTQPQTQQLAQWPDEEKAREFSDWLRSKVPSKPPVPQPA